MLAYFAKLQAPTIPIRRPKVGVQGRTDEELMIFYAWDDPKDTKFAGIFMDFWDKLKMVVAHVSNWQQGYDESNVFNI